MVRIRKGEYAFFMCQNSGLRPPPAIDRPPGAVADGLAIGQEEGVVDGRPDRAAETARRRSHFVPHQFQALSPKVAQAGIGRQLAAVVGFEVAILAEMDGPRFACAAGRPAQPGIMDDARWAFAAEPPLLYPSQHWSWNVQGRVGSALLDRPMHAGKKQAPGRLVRHRSHDDRRMIETALHRFQIGLQRAAARSPRSTAHP